MVASFDSASVLHAATVAALNGQPFPKSSAVRRRLGPPYALPAGCRGRCCAASTAGSAPPKESILAGLAKWICPRSLVVRGLMLQWRYPAVMLGSSNGALAHLAAAMQVPWLPDTVLLPVTHVGDTDRADQAMDFGRSVAPALLDRNPDIVLHHMHDQLQDLLIMAERMSYFRVKWCRLPGPYATFVEERLAHPGGTVVVVRDHSNWPVTRVGRLRLSSRRSLWYASRGVSGATAHPCSRRCRGGIRVGP